jgi:hypothetical protein
MKKIFTIILLLIHSLLIGDGGDGYSSHDYDFKVYDPSTGLLFVSVTNKVKMIPTDTKSKPELVINNIAVYDVKQNSTVHVFDTTFRETIEDFVFETEYIDSSASMDLFSNYTTSYRSDFKIMYNFSIAKRNPSANLIIATYSEETKKYSVWICSKNGKGVQRVFTFSKDKNEGYHLNVKNQKLILISKAGGLLDIKSIPY